MDPLATIPSAYRHIFSDLARDAPFRTFCVKEGCDESAPLGPDCFEVTPTLSNFLAARLQDRKSSGRAAPMRAVPSGLDEISHFAAGLCATNPLDVEPPIPRDLRFTIDKIVSLGRDLEEWRAVQFDRLRTAVEQVAPWRQALDASRSVSSEKCSSHVDPTVHALLAHAILWPDVGLPDLIVKGVKPVGSKKRLGFIERKTLFRP